MISASPTSPSIRVQFEKYKLANGLEVILSEDHRLPVVAINIWYHVGPANERAGRTGFAHLFEHMMFQGSKHVGDNQIKTLQAAGATGVNGTTGFDRTNYFETMPAERLELGLWLESDRMAFLLETLTARNLANQRDVVRNERRERENSPYSLVEEELYRQLFPVGHPYHASIIGSHADIESVRLEEVREFCKQFYVPNNATLALVGDFRTSDAKLLVEKYFGDIPSGTVPPKPHVVIPTITSQKRVIVTDRVELPRIYKAWLSPLVYQPGDAATDLLAHILGSGEASRLYRSLVHEKQIAQDVAASNQSMQLGSVFLLEATSKPEVSLEDIERSLDDELWALQSDGPSQEELDRARNTALAQFVFGLEQVGGMSGVADRLNQYNHYTGDPDFFSKDLERYESLTADDIQRAAQRFTAESSVVVQAVPGPKVLVDVPKRTDTERDVEHKSELSDQGWRITTPPANRKPWPELPIPISFRLSNGLRVLFLERHTIPGVVMRFVTQSGSGQNPANLPGLASFTTDMLARGTLQRTQAQIAANFEALGAVWSTWSGPDAMGVNLRVLKKSLEPACDIFADVALNPSFADEEIDRLRRERLMNIAQARDNPRFVAEQELLRELYGTAHPYGNPDIGTTESNERVQKGDIRAHYVNAFRLGSAAVIVVGDASLEEVNQLGEKCFSLSSDSSISIPPSRPVPGPKRVVVVDRPGSPQTQLLIGQIGTVRSNPDYLAIELMNMILGGMFSSRINHNLREVHGYTYGASSQFAYRRYPGPFTISTAVRTDATVDAVKQILGEIEKMREVLPSSGEMTAAREALSRSLISRFDTLASSSGAVTELFAHSLETNHFQVKLAEIATLTKSDILRVANQYLQPGSMIVVAVGDASKIESALEQLRME